MTLEFYIFFEKGTDTLDYAVSVELWEDVQRKARQSMYIYHNVKASTYLTYHHSQAAKISKSVNINIIEA